MFVRKVINLLSHCEDIDTTKVYFEDANGVLHRVQDLEYRLIKEGDKTKGRRKICRFVFTEGGIRRVQEQLF